MFFQWLSNWREERRRKLDAEADRQFERDHPEWTEAHRRLRERNAAKRNKVAQLKATEAALSAEVARLRQEAQCLERSLKRKLN